MKPFRLLLLFLCLCPLAVFAQTAEVGGAVQDPSGAVIPKASVEFRNQDTGVRRQANTSNDGLYHIIGLDPGKYDATVQAKGFKTLTRENITFQVGDKAQIDFKMQVGESSQSVTVDGSGQQINTTDGSVSTVIDRQFVANMPLNGRSFQDLISMTPGVVTASPQSNTSGPGATGDFSINGQRTEANYYIVDGVAANVSAGGSDAPLNAAAGVVSATSALGTTQSLLSVDALQEFRVESSSYSAEYGRAPGGQLSFVTRAGTNSFHGSAYDYLRNGWFDANDWFADHLNQPQQQVHMNDFGGTVGGPLWIPHLYQGKDKTFLFGSYEGLRMSQPVAASIQYVPDLYMRQQAPALIQPLLNSFPLPTGIDYGTPQAPSLAQFFKGYSVPARIDSTSIRLDHTFTSAFSAFFRFADTPSSADSRSLSLLTSGNVNTQTYTFGTTYILSSSMTDQFRLGYSRSHSGSTTVNDSFGGATPTDLVNDMTNRTGITGQNQQGALLVYISGVGYGFLNTVLGNADQHQWNLTDSPNLVHGKQDLKFGVDFRSIDNLLTPAPVYVTTDFFSANSVLTNMASSVSYSRELPASPIMHQFALYAQDDWRISRRVALSGGIRWEVAPPPHNDGSPEPYTLSGSVNNPSSLTLSPSGTPLWHTAWFSFAPRFGIAWQAHSQDGWATVLRAGGGVFFDTSNEIATSLFEGFGYSNYYSYSNVALPLTQAQQIDSVSVAPPYSYIYAYPSHLQLPYTLEWNTSIEQQLGEKNTATISYVGSAGRRLPGQEELDLSSFSPSLGTVLYLRSVTSDYDALQAKIQRSVRKGLNALVAYTWSHSLDYGSNFASIPLTRGNSDFDVRNSVQAGVTWELPHASLSKLASGVLNGWELDGRLLARTAFPVTLEGNYATDPTTGSTYFTNVDLVPGEPIYLYGSQYPGGRSLNRAAFAYPSGSDPGDAPRNFARGFGESQVNFAVRRDFPFSERLHLQFRAEAFNVLNHPNFGYVEPALGDTTFGQATAMLNRSLGTVTSQYQQGGPRSMQFSLRLSF